MNINKFKKNLIIRLILLTVLSFGIIIFAVIQIANTSFIKSADSEDLMIGARIGGAVGGGSLLLFNIIRTILTLSNKAKLQKAFISENDERKKHIEYKYSKFAVECMTILLGVGLIISTFFNIIIFWTLYITLVAFALIVSIGKLYFNRKY